jgi:hypothetical protein
MPNFVNVPQKESAECGVMVSEPKERAVNDQEIRRNSPLGGHLRCRTDTQEVDENSDGNYPKDAPGATHSAARVLLALHLFTHERRI